MQTVTVVARETFPYDGITRYRGDTFDATVEDARILKLAQRVADAPADSAETPLAHTASTDSEPPRSRRGRRRVALDETPTE